MTPSELRQFMLLNELKPSHQKQFAILHSPLRTAGREMEARKPGRYPPIAIQLYGEMNIRSVFATAHGDAGTRKRAELSCPLGWLAKTGLRGIPRSVGFTPGRSIILVSHTSALPGECRDRCNRH